ncbi:MAG: hypothetical protein NWR72_07480 [Bacteroidia bacterium]|nr:hypothetical protein [Bacteroidia bacterium]
MNESGSVFQSIIPEIRQKSAELRHALGWAIVIIDDDPTGNQTVHGIPLLGSWTVELLKEELAEDSPAFFILANTRSLPEAEAVARMSVIARNLREASESVGKSVLVISRSDSTLRGHFPAEIDALSPLVDPQKRILIFAPAMFEGGRVTIEDIQYLEEGEQLTPVGQTEYANDPVFGYRNSYLPDWLVEKTGDPSLLDRLKSIAIGDLAESALLRQKLSHLQAGEICLLNAAHYGHMDLAALAIWEWLASEPSRQVLVRSSSSFLPSFLGLPPQGLLSPATLKLPSGAGGVVIVGSFVSKTTSQLTRLLSEREDLIRVELDPAKLEDTGVQDYLLLLTQQIDETVVQGHHVVLFTSRTLVQKEDAEAQLLLGQMISDALVAVVKGLKVKPRFLIAKGGITSHVLAVEALEMMRSKVKGQILPGIPVWEMGAESRFPGLTYVVFPGNVGGSNALVEAVNKLS